MRYLFILFILFPSLCFAVEKELTCEWAYNGPVVDQFRLYHTTPDGKENIVFQTNNELREYTLKYDGVVSGRNVFEMTAISPDGVETLRSKPYFYEYIQVTEDEVVELTFKLKIKDVD